jgi:hypothetical protein
MWFVLRSMLPLLRNKLFFLISIVTEATLVHFAKPMTLMGTKVYGMWFVMKGLSHDKFHNSLLTKLWTYALKDFLFAGLEKLHLTPLIIQKSLYITVSLQ